MRTGSDPERQAAARHRTRYLVRRLVGEFLRPRLGRMLLAFLAMAIVAGATAANAWLMQPMLDRVFVARDERLLLVIPVAVIALAIFKGA
ncbi:MAG TPA: hypothetical protein VFA22_02320, partial [Stellaceae bacterium]|nr:hypothetical protein [Stellaceae bacterium]